MNCVLVPKEDLKVDIVPFIQMKTGFIYFSEEDLNNKTLQEITRNLDVVQTLYESVTVLVFVNNLSSTIPPPNNRGPINIHQVNFFNLQMEVVLKRCMRIVPVTSAQNAAKIILALIKKKGNKTFSLQSTPKIDDQKIIQTISSIPSISEMKTKQLYPQFDILSLCNAEIEVILFLFFQNFEYLNEITLLGTTICPQTRNLFKENL